MKDQAALLKRSDAQPTSELSFKGKVILVVAIILLILVFSWLENRQDCDPNVQNCATSSGRSSGGSWGGYSSGGSHK
jgi:hypothetical protein